MNNKWRKPVPVVIEAEQYLEGGDHDLPFVEQDVLQSVTIQELWDTRTGKNISRKMILEDGSEMALPIMDCELAFFNLGQASQKEKRDE